MHHPEVCFAAVKGCVSQLTVNWAWLTLQIEMFIFRDSAFSSHAQVAPQQAKISQATTITGIQKGEGGLSSLKEFSVFFK